MLDFNVADGVAEGITCPTLVCSGASDLFLAGQPEKLYEHLTCPKTLISFTAEDAADAHVQVGAMRLACSRIGDWLDGTFSTAPAWPAGSGLARGRAGGVGDRDEAGLNEASKT
jgi:hypothetical protein